MKKNIKIFLLILSLTTLKMVNAGHHNQAVITDNDLQKKIYVEINAYRRAHGLKELTLNEVISRQAQQHSHDMAENKVPFGHDGFYQRASRLRYSFSSFRGVAENVAYIDMDANRIVKLWLASSGHRKNIEGNFNLTGIGVAHTHTGRVYATQIFLRANINKR